MASFEYNYCRQQHLLHFDDVLSVEVAVPRKLPVLVDSEQAIAAAMAEPIGARSCGK